MCCLSGVLCVLFTLSVSAEEMRTIHYEPPTPEERNYDFVFSPFHERHRSDLAKQFDLDRVGENWELANGDWLITCLDERRLLRYDGYDLIDFDPIFEGRKPYYRFSERGVYAMSVDDNLVGYIEPGGNKWKSADIPLEFAESKIIDFELSRSSELLVIFKSAQRLGLVKYSSDLGEVLAQGWFNDEDSKLIGEPMGMHSFEGAEWLFSSSTTDTLFHMNFVDDIEILRVMKFDGQLVIPYPIGEGISAIRWRQFQEGEKRRVICQLYTEKGLGPFQEIDGIIITDSINNTFIFSRYSGLGYISKINPNTLVADRIYPSFPLERFSHPYFVGSGESGRYMLAGTNTAMLLDGSKPIGLNAPHYDRLSLGFPKSTVGVYAWEDDDVFIYDHPESDSSHFYTDVVYSERGLLFTDNSLIIDLKQSGFEVSLDDYGLSVDDFLSASIVGGVREDDDAYSMILSFMHKGDDRLKLLMVEGENTRLESLNIKALDRFVESRIGFVKLDDHYAIFFKNSYHKDGVFLLLDKGFDIINSVLIPRSSGDSLDAILASLEKIFDMVIALGADLKDISDLIPRPDSNMLDEDIVLIRIKSNKETVYYSLSLIDERATMKEFGMPSFESVFLGIDRLDRMIFKSIDAQYAVVGEGGSFHAESIFAWRLPDAFTILESKLMNESEHWLNIRRNGYRHSFLLRNEPMSDDPFRVKVNLQNSTTQAGEDVIVSLDPTRKYGFGGDLLSYYYRWRVDEGAWSPRVQLDGKPVRIPTNQPGMYSAEFQVIDYFGRESEFTPTVSFDVLPIPLQKRGWFPYATGGVAVVLILLLSISVTQTVHSISNARSLAHLNRTLEDKVRDRTAEIDAQNQELIATNLILESTNENLEVANDRIQETSKALAEASRSAGMAEVASGIIHNVGNVFNSVAVSLNLLRENQSPNSIRKGLRKLSELMEKNLKNESFWKDEVKRKRLFEYLNIIEKSYVAFSSHSHEELERIDDKVSTIREILRAQEKYTDASLGVRTACSLQEMISDALDRVAINVDTDQMDLKIEQESPNDSVFVDSHYAVEILKVLLQNALEASAPAKKRAEIFVAIRQAEGNAEQIEVSVKDHGVGISKESLNRLFAHGFTTKSSGKGFDLHNAANLAAMLDGELSAYSAGEGTGATFTLSLPAAAEVRA